MPIPRSARQATHTSVLPGFPPPGHFRVPELPQTRPRGSQGKHAARGRDGRPDAGPPPDSLPAPWFHNGRPNAGGRACGVSWYGSAREGDSNRVPRTCSWPGGRGSGPSCGMAAETREIVRITQYVAGSSPRHPPSKVPVWGGVVCPICIPHFEHEQCTRVTQAWLPYAYPHWP